MFNIPQPPHHINSSSTNTRSSAQRQPTPPPSHIQFAGPHLLVLCPPPLLHLNLGVQTGITAKWRGVVEKTRVCAAATKCCTEAAQRSKPHSTTNSINTNEAAQQCPVRSAAAPPSCWHAQEAAAGPCRNQATHGCAHNNNSHSICSRSSFSSSIHSSCCVATGSSSHQPCDPLQQAQTGTHHQHHQRQQQTPAWLRRARCCFFRWVC